VATSTFPLCEVWFIVRYLLLCISCDGETEEEEAAEEEEEEDEEVLKELVFLFFAFP
jgi:hypothetical protein